MHKGRGGAKDAENNLKNSEPLISSLRLSISASLREINEVNFWYIFYFIDARGKMM